jgi:hypothetical protein
VLKRARSRSTVTRSGSLSERALPRRVGPRKLVERLVQRARAEAFDVGLFAQDARPRLEALAVAAAAKRRGAAHELRAGARGKPGCRRDRRGRAKPSRHAAR